MKTFQYHTVSINHKGFLFFVISCISIFFSNCKNDSDIKVDKNSYVEFYYLAPNRNYPMNFNCSPLKSGPLPSDSERFYLKVTDTSFMNKLYSGYSRLKIVNENGSNFDARTQMLVHLKGRTDTICMGKISGLIINGKPMENSETFFSLVNDEIAKNYTPLHIQR